MKQINSIEVLFFFFSFSSYFYFYFLDKGLFRICVLTVSAGYIEPIPTLLQGVIEHLIQWRLLPDSRRPNSCIVNFFDEVHIALLDIFFFDLDLIMQLRSISISPLPILDKYGPNHFLIKMQGGYSQPFLKPPHLEQPLSTLLLSESKMAFGCTLVSHGEGNYRGPLMLSLNKGYVTIIIIIYKTFPASA